MQSVTFGDGTVVNIQPGFLLSINGEIDFIGLISASGSLTIAITSTAFTLDFNVSLQLGPLVLTASGFAGVYYDTAHNDVGLVLQLDVGINFDIFDIIIDQGQRPDPAEHDRSRITSRTGSRSTRTRSSSTSTARSACST